MADLLSKTDEELMALYQDGSEKAFNSLYARYSGKVYAYLRKRLRDETSVNDVFQAVFMKLHNSRAQYNPKFAFSPWLFTVTRTAMFDWLRHARLSEERFELIDPERTEEMSYTDRTESAPNIDLADLSRLPASQREAIKLRYIDELEFEEIAERLQTTPVNVRKLVSRGIKAIRDRFKND